MANANTWRIADHMDIYEAINAIIEKFDLEDSQRTRDELWSILDAYGDERYDDGRASGYY